MLLRQREVWRNLSCEAVREPVARYGFALARGGGVASVEAGLSSLVHERGGVAQRNGAGRSCNAGNSRIKGPVAKGGKRGSANAGQLRKEQCSRRATVL